ncbi:PTS sugar transporter subunit IIA [Lacrimispora celerecrescens]|uniref:PTS sugar transporter subunit IIA n=1 Tax=Lacrimispora celerecrescens TaxID=29354 RepID=UPI0016478E45|nr:PTS fructose transporter subunit IIA [Lacrimispora celerecrescens]
MTAFLLVSHGTYSKAMLETAEMILGPQSQVAAVGLAPSQSPDDLKTEIRRSIESLSGPDLLILTDVSSGTPANTIMALSQEYSFRHLTGINLPLLIEALISRQFVPIGDLASTLMQNAASTFIDVDEMMYGKQEADDSTVGF